MVNKNKNKKYLLYLFKIVLLSSLSFLPYPPAPPPISCEDRRYPVPFDNRRPFYELIGAFTLNIFYQLWERRTLPDGCSLLSLNPLKVVGSFSCLKLLATGL